MNEEKKIRNTLIQIKPFPNLKQQLGYIKVHEKKSFTELFEEWIEFHYYFTFLITSEDFKNGSVKERLEKYVDVKEMQRVHQKY